MTISDPLALWSHGEFTAHHPSILTKPIREGWVAGANDRLDALRPLIDAADRLAEEVNDLGTGPDSLADARDAYYAIRTLKGDTP